MVELVGPFMFMVIQVLYIANNIITLGITHERLFLTWRSEKYGKPLTNH